MPEHYLLDKNIGDRLKRMLLAYESEKARGSVWHPGFSDSGIIIRPIKVTVALPAATATLATDTGRGIVLQVGENLAIGNYQGNATAVPVINWYPAIVPVDGLISGYSFGGKWYHLTYACPG